MDELIQRLEDAKGHIWVLIRAASTQDNEREERRLRGKAEGIDLALSYARESQARETNR